MPEQVKLDMPQDPLAPPDEPEVVNGEIIGPETALALLESEAQQLAPRLAAPISYTSLQAARDWPALLALAQGMFASHIGAPSSLKSAEAVATVLLAGNEDGLGPIEAVTELHIINGRVGRSANLMRKLVYKRIPGAVIEEIEVGPDRVILEGRRPNHPPCRVEWTADDARKAKLDKKDVWLNYAEDMLYARATGRLCRRLFPDAFSSPAYTPEELADEPVPPSPAPAANGNAPHALPRRAPQGPPAPPVTAPPDRGPAVFATKDYGDLVEEWKTRFPDKKRTEFVTWASLETGADMTRAENWSAEKVSQLRANLA